MCVLAPLISRYCKCNCIMTIKDVKSWHLFRANILVWHLCNSGSAITMVNSVAGCAGLYFLKLGLTFIHCPEAITFYKPGCDFFTLSDVIHFLDWHYWNSGSQRGDLVCTGFCTFWTLNLGQTSSHNPESSRFLKLNIWQFNIFAPLWPWVLNLRVSWCLDNKLWI